MPTFINQTTGEYPRYPGDVALEPDADWAEVVEVAPPDPATASEGNCWIPDEPTQIDGVWHQAWKQIPIPVDPRQQEIQKALDAGIDLALLGVI